MTLVRLESESSYADIGAHACKLTHLSWVKPEHVICQVPIVSHFMTLMASCLTHHANTFCYAITHHGASFAQTMNPA